MLHRNATPRLLDLESYVFDKHALRDQTKRPVVHPLRRLKHSASTVLFRCRLISTFAVQKGKPRREGPSLETRELKSREVASNDVAVCANARSATVMFAPKTNAYFYEESNRRGFLFAGVAGCTSGGRLKYHRKSSFVSCGTSKATAPNDKQRVTLGGNA